MSEITQQAARLLEMAQSGRAAEALAEAEKALTRAESAGMHFVRAIALTNLGEPHAAIPAFELMAAAATRENSPGWLACALASRAAAQLRLGAGEGESGVLQDLVTAEAAVAAETDPVAAVNGRVAVAIGYFELRLYELVGAQYDAAYEMSPPDNGNRAMWLYNQAELHLYWALELYQVGQVAEAESHTARGEVYALRAADEARGPDAAVWRDFALLAAACARADRHDPHRAAREITEYLDIAERRGMGATALAYARPFHAVALRRSGRPAEALTIIERAVANLTPDAGWLITAATHRTHAVLRGADAEIGLRYGDSLAGAMWRHRLRTLQSVEAMKSLELLRDQHRRADGAGSAGPAGRRRVRDPTAGAG